MCLNVIVDDIRTGIDEHVRQYASNKVVFTKRGHFPFCEIPKNEVIEYIKRAMEGYVVSVDGDDLIVEW